MNKLLIALIIFALIGYYIINSSKVITYGATTTILYTPIIDNQTFKTKEATITIGNNQIIRGLELALLGMRAGENKTITIPPELAYGEFNKSLIKAFNLTLFSEANLSEPVIGQRVIINNKEGVVINKTSDYALINFNHPLAGKNITVMVKVLNVK